MLFKVYGNWSTFHTGINMHVLRKSIMMKTIPTKVRTSSQANGFRSLPHKQMLFMGSEVDQKPLACEDGVRRAIGFIIRMVSR